MDHATTDVIVGAAALTILGGACLLAYLKVGPTLPEAHRLRALTFLMSLPLVTIAMIATSNPLPALVTLVQAAWRQGPSG